MTISLDQLHEIFPTCPIGRISSYYKELVKWMDTYDINTIPRIAAFLAQIGHESGAFMYVAEIASGAAYEGRADLGNTSPGDGMKYKGRGLIQVTGKANYKLLDDYFRLQGELLNNPKLLETPSYAVQSACWYWQDRKLSGFCDQSDEWTTVFKGITYTKFSWITKKINGGLNGLADRLKYYNKALEVLSS